MPGTVRNEAQLEALFLDNNVGEISALDGRDLIATVFGFSSLVDPGADWDDSDSAHVGAFFGRGSFVWNVATQILWGCFSGTTHLAVWRPIGPATIPPGGVVQVHPGTNISVTGTIADPVVNFSGTLPAGQVGAGYPFSQLGGSASLGQLPAGYPFGALSGAGPVPFAGITSVFGQWYRVNVDYTAMAAVGGTTAHLVIATLPAHSVLMDIMYFVNTGWSLIGILPNPTFGWSNGEGSVPSSYSGIASGNNAASDVIIHPAVFLPQARNRGATWSLVLTYQGGNNVSGLTSGNTDVWMLLALLP